MLPTDNKQFDLPWDRISWLLWTSTTLVVINLTLFRLGFFGAAPHGWGRPKRPPPLPKICRSYSTIMKLGTVTPYLEKIQKLYELRDTLFEFCWHQHFVTGNQEILLYQEIQIEIPFRYVVSNSSNFSWIFKNCFNKHGHNFDDDSKNGYVRPS